MSSSGFLPVTLEHLVGGLLDDLGARVVGLVDAVAESHQPALARLHALDERRDVLDRADLRAACAAPLRSRRRAAGRTAPPAAPASAEYGSACELPMPRIALVLQFCS